MDKKYAIFDMDGTLLDSMAFWQQLPQQYLDTLGHYTLTKGQLAALMEMSLEEGSAYLAAQFSLPRTPQEITRELDAIISRQYKEILQPKPLVPAFLESLAQKGVKMCIASATAQPLVEACFARLGLLRYFDFCLSCVEEKTDKFHPDIYLAAAGKLGAGSPAEAAVFEDVLFAVKTAKKAGFYTVGVQDAAEKENWDSICRLADETVSFDRV